MDVRAKYLCDWVFPTIILCYSLKAIDHCLRHRIYSHFHFKADKDLCPSEATTQNMM